MNPHRWISALALLGLFAAAWHLAVFPSTVVEEGVAAYRSGDFAQATRQFRQALDRHPADWLHRNLALSALAAGDLELAARSADALARSGRAAPVAWRDFLLGNIAWRRSELAQFEAQGPVPPAGAMARAIAHTEEAIAAWSAADEGVGSWPAARRNLELAVERLEALTQEREQQQGGAESASTSTPRVDPEPPLEQAEVEQMMQRLERMDLERAEQEARRRPAQEVLDW